MSISIRKYKRFPEEFEKKYTELLNLTHTKYKINLELLWLLSYKQNYIPANEAYILIAFEKEEPVGFLPLYIDRIRGTRFWQHRVLRILGSGPTDFFDVIAERGKELSIVQAMISYVMDDTSWEKFELTEIPASSISFQNLQKFLPEKNIDFSLDFPNGYFFVDTKSRSWEEYEIEFNKKNKDLAKSERRITNDGFKLSVQTFKEDIYRHLIQSIELYEARRKSLGQKNTYETEERNRFLERVIGEKEKTGAVELNKLVDETGEVWAFQLDWLSDGVRYHWNHAYNEDFKRYSPGKVLLKEIMKRSFEDPNIKECNYMRGLSSYKSKLVDQKEMLGRIIIENPRSLRLKATKLAGKVLSIIRR